MYNGLLLGDIMKEEHKKAMLRINTIAVQETVMQNLELVVDHLDPARTDATVEDAMAWGNAMVIKRALEFLWENKPQ